LQARIEAEEAKMNLEQARTVRQIAWRRLAALVGQPSMEPAPLAGDVTGALPDLGRDQSLDRLLGQSPELAQARARLERARCELARQQALRVPNLEFAGAAKYDTGSRFAVADVALGAPLLLFDRNQGNIRSAWAALVAASNEVQRVQLDLCGRFAATYGQYANARLRVDTYRETILPNAKESLELIATGYREGEFGYLSLLTAQRTYFSVNLDYLASLQQFWARCVQIEGLLLSGGLEAPP
jgi:cobalt-zinc-cadmium efflux system outer membrane protein